MNEMQIAFLWRLAELSDGWRRAGHRAIASHHHFSDLAPKRDAVRVLNTLIAKGYVVAERHGRYKVWALGGTAAEARRKEATT